jgi:hypothetical protein
MKTWAKIVITAVLVMIALITVGLIVGHINYINSMNTVVKYGTPHYRPKVE